MALQAGSKYWKINRIRLIFLIVFVVMAGAVLQNYMLPRPTSMDLLPAGFAPSYTHNEMAGATGKYGELGPSLGPHAFNFYPALGTPRRDSAIHIKPPTSNVSAIVDTNISLTGDDDEVITAGSDFGTIQDDTNDLSKDSIVSRPEDESEKPGVISDSHRVKRSVDKRSARNVRRSSTKAKRDRSQIMPPVRPREDIYRVEEKVWSMSPNEQLLYAKHMINNGQLVLDDPDLHPPLFRNFSVFKRSYELMEQILKVYVYKDGNPPIFHRPSLQGIYASEGWFMKLLEENRWFVVKNPERAHLFYLPYSSRQLQLALYVPDSHNMHPLAIYLKDYVNTIASKYPYWNRTRGSDHFLVACHDWGPYTTKEHEELCRNTIKALCNADVSEGFFVPGKDVSLPETTIRSPKRPLRAVGGRPVSQRSILAFFAGNMHGRVRPTLLKYWGDKDDEDMKIYGPLPNRVSRKMSYIQHMKTSRYCICPMGYEVNSPRIVEAIYYECVPVIIADNFALPFNDVLDWSAFSVVVAEKDIPRLKEILLSIPLRRYMTMHTNVVMLQKHFLWHSRPIKYDLFHMILHSIWFNRLNQIS